jgi:hypothetical protein
VERDVAIDLGLVKAVAGPIATIIAAFAALTVTYRFGKQQLKIAATQLAVAKSQRDIAIDKLKYDLFEKRYNIYLAAKKLIEQAASSMHPRDALDPRLAELRVTLNEARFFYPPIETAIFMNILQLSAKYHIASTTRTAPNESPETTASASAIAASSLMEMVEIHARLPELLERELGFAQLTTQ